MIILVFVDVRVEKNKQSMFQALKRIINPASGVFLFIMLGAGIGNGIYVNYVPVYLQEELKASSAMIGKKFFEIML